jgi:hypothetical protein
MTHTITLSKQTIQILKNFAQIEDTIKIHPGNEVYSLARVGNIFAYAKIEEEIPVEVNIYNLSQFLATVNLFDEPFLVMSDSQVLIKSGRQRVTYRFAEPEIIPDPRKTPSVGQYLFSGLLDAELVARITKIASVLAVPKIQIKSSSGVVSLRVTDPKKMTSNVFEVDLGECDTAFDHVISVENFRLLPGTYEIHIPDRRAVKFTHNVLPVYYFIAAEKN